VDHGAQELFNIVFKNIVTVTKGGGVVVSWILTKSLLSTKSFWEIP